MVFKINVDIYPKSANAYDSLGDSYMKNKEYNSAIENYEKSLQLDPKNKNAEEMLKRLRKLKIK